MPEQVRCPSCNAALRVPDNLLGKNVKCPKCQTTFTAEMEEAAERQSIAREPAPARRSRAMEEPEEEDFLEEEEEEERPRPRRRGKRRSAAAMEAVSGPATALLVVGIIDIVLGILCVLIYLGLSLLARGAPPAMAGQQRDLMSSVVMGIFLGIGTIIFGSIITMGASKMKKLTSYGLAMTACILAMMPFVNCCLLGLPFGIWALTVLNKPEVKDAFR